MIRYFFTSSLFRPKSNISDIVKHDRTKISLIFIFIVFLMANVLSVLQQDLEYVMPILFMSLIQAFIQSAIYVFGIGSWNGLVCKWMNGQGSLSDMRYVVIWSVSPMIISIILKLIVLYLPLPTSLAIKIPALIDIIFGIWILVLLTINTSEVQKFSKQKAFICILIASIPLIILGIFWAPLLQ